MKLKILIVTGIFPPDIGGPATYSEKLAKELISRGHDIAVISFSDKKLNLNYPYFIERVRRDYPLLMRYIVYFYRVFLLARKYDILFAQDPFIAGLSSVVAGFILRKKVVVKIVGDFAWEYGRNKGLIDDDIDSFQTRVSYPSLISLIRSVQKFVCRCSSKIITPSYYLKGIIKQWSIPEDKIIVIYNAVDLKTIEPKANLLLINKKITIISIGRLVSWKGFDCLIEVFGDLYPHFPNSKLVIIGDGPLMPYLRDLAANNPGKDSILFTGSLDRKKVSEWYNKASCLVLFSGYEGLSHVLLEAISFGLPVIASRKGGNVELIDDGVNGVLVDWPNKVGLKSTLLSFLEKPDSFISNPGLIDKEKFSWDHMINSAISILKNCEKK